VAEKKKAKGTAKQTKAPKVKAAKRTRVEDLVRIDDSDMERQVEELMRLEEEEEEVEEPPETCA
jgi:hypothetical protein